MIIQSQQKSLAKFYLLAQQIEYVVSTSNNVLLTPPLPQHPLLPVENFSSILNVQWTTYWTIHLVPTTTCLDVLKYISQKTSREVRHLKLADSEGKIVDHESLLITHRCKKFVVFEEIDFNHNNNNNNNNQNNSSSNQSSTTTSLPSSPNLLLNEQQQSSSFGGSSVSSTTTTMSPTSTPSSPFIEPKQHHSPTGQRKQPPAPPPRSPCTYTPMHPSSSSNPLLNQTELISEPLPNINNHHQNNNNNNQTTSSSSSSSLSSTSISNQTGSTIITPTPMIGTSRSNTTSSSSSSSSPTSSIPPHFSLANGGSSGGLVSSLLSNLVNSSSLQSTSNGNNSNSSSTNTSPPTSPASSRKNSGNNSNISITSNTSNSNSRPSSPNTNNNTNQSTSNYQYCKFLDKVEVSNIQPTTEKGKILDNYFNHYYQELFKYIHQRSRRYQKVREFVKESGFDECGAQAWYQKHYDNETNYLRNKRAGMKLKDFKILTQIGKGGFGQVFLAVKKDTGDIVTLKRIRKQAYEWANQRMQVSHEKTVMMSEAGGKWITKLLYAFQDSSHLYLAMEYHCGGDFRALLNNLGMLGEEDARFYMVEMVEAINSLHSLKYIHRDIKPSNFVIDKSGHIKLIDFGLSKEGYESRNGLNQQSMSDFRKSCLDGTFSLRSTMTNRLDSNVIAYRRPTAHSAVGSPEYMAPEIVSDSGYDLKCDFWSLGCVFMEMLCGFNPFCADTPNDVFVNIIQWKEVLDWPLFTQDLSPEAADILKHMLCETTDRFKTIEEFKSHPFFNMNGMTWESILETTPPFIPKVESDIDTSYFEDAVNNDPTSWEIEDTEKSRDPFSNLNIPFFTYRKSSALSLLAGYNG